MNRNKAKWMAICVACVAGFEGLRTVAYLDPVGIPTLCFGQAVGVKLGQKATLDECKAMLAESLAQADQAVMLCTKVKLSDERRAALVSFTYNVGSGAYCSSTLLKKLNAGDTVGACDQLLRWTKAKGVELPGLVKRRQEERKLCLAGLA